jgi:DNA helicase II / ATP-dependent DNA helicase PcrA
LACRIRKDKGQCEAFNRSGHCVVVAGPGAGKTRILVLKAAKLLYEDVYQPRGIACVTYAHAMAEELRRQLESLGVTSESNNVFIGTLHSFCFSNVLVPFGKNYGIPVPNPLRIASDRRQASIYVEIWRSLDHEQQNKLPMPERDKTTGELQPRLPVDFQRYRRTHLDVYQSDENDKDFDVVVEKYENVLLGSGLIDFDLATKWAVQLVEQQEFVRRALEAKYPWLLVDEYQDLGLALHRIVKSLTSQTSMKLFASGDPNQCIYNFSGASPDYFSELEKSVDLYGQPVRLNVNYRSLPEIIRNASKIPPIASRQQPHRSDGRGLFKILKSDQQLIKLVDILRKLEQHRSVKPHEILILGRYNKNCRDIVNAIKEEYPEMPISKSSSQIYDSRKSLLEWIEKLVQYTEKCGDVRFNDLLGFWAKLHRSNNVSENDVLSLENRLRLFAALERAEQYSKSAFEWLTSFVSNSGLEDKCQGS